tara:strand:- start:1667 stop:2257 length:591 start_codon:yes stop_codon:yes gene_type:complete
MLKNQLCITNSKILYEILNEIKTELSFDLKFEEKFDEQYQTYRNKKNFQNIIYLIINKSRIPIEKKINLNLILILEKLPIKIWKLIEKINIFFLKVNFKFQSNIFIKNYELNLNSRIISKNNKVLKLTEKEVLVILFLFNSQTPKNVNELQKQVWKQKSILETHTVETHIYRLRKKFLNYFDDNSFILSEKTGYSI